MGQDVISPLPVVLVVSDSLGDTASDVVLASAGQFEEGLFRVSRLSKVRDANQVREVIEDIVSHGSRVAVFHTIVDRTLRQDVCDLVEELGISSVDLMGPALDTLSGLTGSRPKEIPGIIHKTDERYFERIECMEYVIAHDDGRGADDLSDADIVLIGVSRTSKTPLSMYLAFKGYRVANIPLALGIDPPAALFDIDPYRIFGLLSRSDVVAAMRDRRLESKLARMVAGDYADPLLIDREMEAARKLMRQLGCFIIRTDGKAIEESAAEIESYIQAIRRKREGVTREIH